MTGVSQIWSEKPAWYFWIAGAPCVYGLHFEEGWNGAPGIADAAGGLFSVKCYPHPDAPVFELFSREEQALALSDCFDGTGTPRFEFLHRIPASLFNAASIEYAIGPDEAWSLLTLEGLNTMRTRYEVQATHWNALLNETVTCSAGEVARKIPGWELGYGLFDRLISLYAYHHKTRPSRVVHTISPGFEIVYEETGTYGCKEISDVSSLSLGVLFLQEPGVSVPEADDFIAAGCKEGGRTTIFDERSACGCDAHGLATISGIPLLNEQWWKMADADYKSHLTSTCGCS